MYHNLSVLDLAFGLILCYSLFVYMRFCCVRFSFLSTMLRDWLERLQNDPFCLEWVVKLYLTFTSLRLVVSSDCRTLRPALRYNWKHNSIILAGFSVHHCMV